MEQEARVPGTSEAFARGTLQETREKEQMSAPSHADAADRSREQDVACIVLY